MSLKADLQISVARSTRAWIETGRSGRTLPAMGVARSTRAWIETTNFVPLKPLTNGRTLYACVD